MKSNSRTGTVNLGLTCQSTQNATHSAIFLRIADSHVTVTAPFYLFLNSVEYSIWFTLL